MIVTSMRETRLYYKGAHQQAYERFETVRLAADEALLKHFVFLLSAGRVVPAHRECHLYEVLRVSETVGRTLTNQFYALYADIRQRVLILGHVFEQCITDLERLRESLSSADFQSAVSPTSSRQGADDRTACGLETRDTAGWRPAPRAEPGKVGRRRKQEGAVYTPAFITRYLVEQALGSVLKTRFDTLRRQHETEAAGTARKALTNPSAYDLAALNDPQRKALIRFWEAWQEEGKPTTPSAKATASSATRRCIPKPSTGRPPSRKSSPAAAGRMSRQ